MISFGLMALLMNAAGVALAVLGYLCLRDGHVQDGIRSSERRKQMTYKHLKSQVQQWCNAIGYDDLIADIARCVGSRMWLSGVSEKVLRNPIVMSLFEAIAVASIYREVESAGLERRARPDKAQNSAVKWAEKVAAKLIADKADYAAVKASVLAQCGVDEEETDEDLQDTGGKA